MVFSLFKRKPQFKANSSFFLFFKKMKQYFPEQVLLMFKHQLEFYGAWYFLLQMK